MLQAVVAPLLIFCEHPMSRRQCPTWRPVLHSSRPPSLAHDPSVREGAQVSTGNFIRMSQFVFDLLCSYTSYRRSLPSGMAAFIAGTFQSCVRLPECAQPLCTAELAAGPCAKVNLALVRKRTVAGWRDVTLKCCFCPISQGTPILSLQWQQTKTDSESM
jgi:hypothetical protein